MKQPCNVGALEKADGVRNGYEDSCRIFIYISLTSGETFERTIFL